MNQLTYEDALELKNAGWPQDTYHEHMHQDGLSGHMGHDTAAIPTLGELVEACGDWFVGLDRYNNGWSATGTRPNGNLVSCKEQDLTSAVAHLWLALNPKK